MRQAVSGDFDSQKIRKFAQKVMNGFDFWFTFVLYSYVEPTNNIAENALRESVMQRRLLEHSGMERDCLCMKRL